MSAMVTLCVDGFGSYKAGLIYCLKTNATQKILRVSSDMESAGVRPNQLDRNKDL
jgi:hypothetical protein